MVHFLRWSGEIAEDDSAVAGHGPNHRKASTIINAALSNGGGFSFDSPQSGLSSFLGRGGTADLSPRINLFLWLVWYRL